MKHATTAIHAALTAPQAPRALLVSIDPAGELQWQPVEHGESVLNISKDLQSHLTDYPHSTEWLTDLRDYLDARLAARAEVRATGGVAIARGRTWEISHVSAFAPITVRGGAK